METLRNVFHGGFISRFGDVNWPARSAGLSVCDFFLVGLPKESSKHVFLTFRP